MMTLQEYRNAYRANLDKDYQLRIELQKLTLDFINQQPFRVGDKVKVRSAAPSREGTKEKEEVLYISSISANYFPEDLDTPYAYAFVFPKKDGSMSSQGEFWRMKILQMDLLERPA